MIYIYGTPSCGGCKKAKMLFKMKRIPFEERDISSNKEWNEFIIRKGFTSIPQIYRDITHLGGYDEVRAMTTEDIIG